MPLTIHEKKGGERFLVVGYRLAGDVLVFGGYRTKREARTFIKHLHRCGIEGYERIVVEEAGCQA